MNLKKHISNFIRYFHIYWLRLKSAFNKDLNLTDKVLIIAPHPDDEVIGCGGLIARLVLECNMPHIAILTGGEGSHNHCCSVAPNDIKTSRRKLTDNALCILSVNREHIHELDFPDGNISTDNSEIKKLNEIIDEIAPNIILVPHWGEGWPDHINTGEIIKKIAPKQATIYEYCVWMWYYNVWRGLDWKNAYKLKMTPREYQLKLEAMDAYIKPLAPCSKPWSGVLPDIFVKANSGDTELYFKVR